MLTLENTNTHAAGISMADLAAELEAISAEYARCRAMGLTFIAVDDLEETAAVMHEHSLVSCHSTVPSFLPAHCDL